MNIGIVIIGRNEGDRLKKCLSSLLTEIKNQENNFTLVYVDSGSIDGSIEYAQKLKIEIVNLDLTEKFTAGRARNEGVKKLLTINSQLDYIQFIDGDCQIMSGWLANASQTLTQNPRVAVVCGRRQELFPEKSVYNLLCDIEWNTPIGEAKACGGDAMMRLSAFQQVNGFNPQLIAGEEPELCLRLRQQHWQIWRIDRQMTLHDANMIKFSQWWKRNFRAGFAFAEVSWLHRESAEKYWVKESRSILLWGLLIPLITIVFSLFFYSWSYLILILYPLLTYKIYRYKKQENYPSQQAFLYSFFCVLGKFPQLLGLLNFQRLRILKKQAKLVEYKNISEANIEQT